MILILTGPSLVKASYRHFLYSYESPVLQEGSGEPETYATFRLSGIRSWFI